MIDRPKAIGLLGALTSEEIRKKKVSEEHLARVAGIPKSVVESVSRGYADLCREREIRKLLKVLFLASQRKMRAKVFNLLFVVHPTKRSIRSLPYKNRKQFISGRSQFAPSSFSLR